jgi:hypothetical protein
MEDLGGKCLDLARWCGDGRSEQGRRVEEEERQIYFI